METMSILKVRELAAKVGCDPRTLARVLRGEFVKGITGARIRDTLTAMKVKFPAPQRPQEAA